MQWVTRGHPEQMVSFLAVVVLLGLGTGAVPSTMSNATTGSVAPYGGPSISYAGSAPSKGAERGPSDRHGEPSVASSGHPRVTHPAPVAITYE